MRTPVAASLLAVLVGAAVSGCGVFGSAPRPGTQPPAPALPAPISGAAGTPAAPLTITALVEGTELVTFSTDNPAIRENRTVTGLRGDRSLVGIDYRMQDGELYGVGDAGGIYTLDGSGGANKVKQLSVALQGERFGVDFNPAANALRIVSDTGQNLRQPFADPAARTAEDKALTNPAAPPATGSVPAEGVGGAGYTNNDTDAATATALFVLDTEADRLSIQSPANAGTLAPVGSLGVDAGAVAGFDVHSPVPGGPSTDMLALATLQVDDRYGLYEIDLLTGKAERLGELAGPVVDIAIPIDGG